MLRSGARLGRISRRTLGLAGALALGVLAAWGESDAQQGSEVRRIGYLRRTTPQGGSVGLESLRGGLRDLGWAEGQNLVIQQRYADGHADRLPRLAAELVGLKIEVLVVDGATTVQAAKAVTSTIPIVFTLLSDPVGDGFAASLARPGGNMTGLTHMHPEIAGKRIELLKTAVSRASRVGLLLNPTNVASRFAQKNAEAAANALRVELIVFEARNVREIEDAFAAMKRAGVGAVAQANDALFFSERRRIVELAAKHRLPGIFEAREFAEAGGLLSYGANTPEIWRRAATYVDKILRGARPGDLPVEQPTRYDLVVNLKTAQLLGLTLPPSLVAVAETVIE